MRISLNTSKWYDAIWASFIFFTRLPLWRIYSPPRESYRSVVEYWPLTGWLTGCVMGAIIYLGAAVMPYSIAILLAIAARILLTGGLHEDGLADFIDGFGGGGHDRQRVLDIMKDSRVGTYGVLGLGVYMLLLYFSLSSMPAWLAAMVVITGNPLSRMMAGQITTMMPYARTEETAKARVTYRKMSVAAGIGLGAQGLLPLAGMLIFLDWPAKWHLLVLVPGLTQYFLYLFIWHRLKGYTGDCCGAACLLTELAFYLCASCLHFNHLLP